MTTPHFSPFASTLCSYNEVQAGMLKYRHLHIRVLPLWSLTLNNQPVANICPICHDPLKGDGHLSPSRKVQCGTLACNHTYHEGCVAEWLEHCPVCRLAADVHEIVKISL